MIDVGKITMEMIEIGKTGIASGSVTIKGGDGIPKEFENWLFQTFYETIRYRYLTVTSVLDPHTPTWSRCAKSDQPGFMA